MKYVLAAVLIAAAAYLIFIAAPAAVGLYAALSRKNGTPLEKRDLEKTYYAPYQAQLFQAAPFYKSQKTDIIKMVSYDGTELTAEYIGAGTKKTVIFMHGYRAPAVDCFWTVGKDLYGMGFNLLFAHERAENLSGGKCIGMGVRESEDLFYWIRYAEEELHSEEILLYGMSMGAAAVGYASDRIGTDRVKAMVIDCGFTSPEAQLRRDMKIRHLPDAMLFPVMSFLSDRILHLDLTKPVSDDLKQTKIPAFFLHGKEDTTVPVEQGIRNYRDCASEKELVLVAGAPHTLAYTAGGKEVKEKLAGFLNKYFKTGE